MECLRVRKLPFRWTNPRSSGRVSYLGQDLAGRTDVGTHNLGVQKLCSAGAHTIHYPSQRLFEHEMAWIAWINRRARGNQAT
jgi:hypothetical protein